MASHAVLGPDSFQPRQAKAATFLPHGRQVYSVSSSQEWRGKCSLPGIILLCEKSPILLTASLPKAWTWLPWYKRQFPPISCSASLLADGLLSLQYYSCASSPEDFSNLSNPWLGHVIVKFEGLLVKGTQRNSPNLKTQPANLSFDAALGRFIGWQIPKEALCFYFHMP